MLINACIVSKAAGGVYELAVVEKVKDCPLDLSEKEARHCNCRRRQPVGTIEKNGKQIYVHVVECRYPKLWNWEEIENEGALRNSIRRRAAQT